MLNKEKAVHILKMKAVLQSFQIQSAIDRFNASEGDEQHRQTLTLANRLQNSELVVGELTRWRNDRKPER